MFPESGERPGRPEPACGGRPVRAAKVEEFLDVLEGAAHAAARCRSVIVVRAGIGRRRISRDGNAANARRHAATRNECAPIFDGKRLKSPHSSVIGPSPHWPKSCFSQEVERSHAPYTSRV